MKRHIPVILTALFMLQPVTATAAPWYAPETVSDVVTNTVLPHLSNNVQRYAIVGVILPMIILPFCSVSEYADYGDQQDETLHQKEVRKEFERIVERVRQSVAQDQKTEVHNVCPEEKDQKTDANNVCPEEKEVDADVSCDEDNFDYYATQAYDQHNLFC